MPQIIAGAGGVNRQVKKIPLGVGGVNRDCKEAWAGVGGVNRKVFSSFSYRVETSKSPYYYGELTSTIDANGNWVASTVTNLPINEALYCYLDIYFDTPLSFAANETIFECTAYLFRNNPSGSEKIGFGALAYWDQYPDGGTIMQNTSATGKETMTMSQSAIMPITNMTRLSIYFLKSIYSVSPNLSSIIYNGGLTVRGNQIFFK